MGQNDSLILFAQAIYRLTENNKNKQRFTEHVTSISNNYINSVFAP